MKKKENILRTVIWGTLALISGCLGIIGLLEYQKSYGNYKEDLVSIATTFNNTEIIKNYEEINTKIFAEVKRNKIVVTYEGASHNKYIYTLKDTSLETTYEKSDAIANVIAMVILDTINVIRNNDLHGETYSIYSSGDIKNYTLDNGASYKIDNDIIELKVNINVPIKEKKLNNTYIETTDFSQEEINNFNLIKTKSTITLIRDESTISFEDTNGITNDLNTSIQNTLLVLFEKNVYDEYINNVNLMNNNYTGNLINIEINPTMNEKEQEYFTNGSFVRITIKNQKN